MVWGQKFVVAQHLNKSLIGQGFISAIKENGGRVIIGKSCNSVPKYVKTNDHRLLNFSILLKIVKLSSRQNS